MPDCPDHTIDGPDGERYAAMEIIDGVTALEYRGALGERTREFRPDAKVAILWPGDNRAGSSYHDMPLEVPRPRWWKWQRRKRR